MHGHWCQNGHANAVYMFPQLVVFGQLYVVKWSNDWSGQLGVQRGIIWVPMGPTLGKGAQRDKMKGRICRWKKFVEEVCGRGESPFVPIKASGTVTTCCKLLEKGEMGVQMC